MSINPIVKLSEYRKLTPQLHRAKQLGRIAADTLRDTAVELGRTVTLPVAVLGIVGYGMCVGASCYLRRVTDIGWALVQSEWEELHNQDAPYDE